MLRGPFLSRLSLACCCVCLLANTPAHADAKSLGLGIGIGIIMNKALDGLGVEKKKPAKPRTDSSGSGSSGGGQSASQQQQAEVTTNYAAEEEARKRIEQNELGERNRNVEKAVAAFLETLKNQHLRLRNQDESGAGVASGSSINQVTAGEVRSEVEKVYAEARLTDFDRFAGELWTRDRLTVQILREAERGIQPYFVGVGAKGPSMADLKDVFGKSAAVVYARALELAEIIGVSHSFDRFIRTIYENSDRVPESLWTLGADGQYERMLSRAINTIDRNYFITDGPVVASDPHGLERLFQFRFRARRALYECLSGHYANMAAGQGGMEAKGALPTTLVIENSLSGANPSRGAGLSSGPRIAERPAQAAGNVQKVASTFESSEVWRLVQGQVTGECNPSMRQVADDARDQGLVPVPARWDGGAGAQPSGGGYALPSTPQYQPANTNAPR